MAKGDDKADPRGSKPTKAQSPAPSGGSSRFSKSADPFDEEVKPGPKKGTVPKPARPVKPAPEPRPGRGSLNKTEPADKGESAPRRERDDGPKNRAEEKAAPEESEAEVEESGAEPRERPRSRFGFRRRDRASTSDEGRGRRVAGLGLDDGYDDEPDDGELDDLPEPPPRFRRPPWWVLVGGAVLALIIVLLFVGEYNTQRYFLVCKGAKAEAHQGRGFPWPFGHSALKIARYRPVPLGVDAQCQSQEMENEAELIQGMLKLVTDEAERRSRSPRAKDLAAARRLVGQGFLLARTDEKQRTRLQKLRAVLDFQQGRVVMRDLEASLQDARRLFTRAKARKTAHAQQAASWILVVDHLLDRLRRRLAGDPKAPRRVTPAAPGARPSPRPAPMAPGSVPDGMKPPAPRPRPGPVPTPAPRVRPDAGVTGGGILL